MRLDKRALGNSTKRCSTIAIGSTASKPSGPQICNTVR
jgi:hypothetical protein